VNRRGILLIVLAAFLWGTTGTAQALGPPDSDPIAVGVARLVVAAPALLLIARINRGEFERPRSARKPVVVAGLAMAFYQPLFFTAVAETGVALGTVVTIGSAPLLTGVLARLFDGEIPSKRWWPATALGIAGVYLIALSASDVGAEPVGILLALGAGLAFAVYILASRRVVEVVNPISGTSHVFSVAAVLSLPLLVWADASWISTPGGLAMAAHLGLVATALAYVLFSLGVRSTRAPSAATASLAEPLTATMLGVFLLGEAPGVAGWAGILLILTGLFVLGSDERRTEVRTV
jgi:DME family drug/metabolite transporter